MSVLLTRVALIALMTASVTAARCPFSQKPARGAAANSASRTVIPDSADQVLQGMSTVLNDNGVLKGILLSDSAYTYEDGSRLELFGVNVTFYTSAGVKDGVMVSRRGTYSARLSRLEARGDVIVKREGGSTLTTPQLVYDQARNQIFTDSSFSLVQPDRQLTGIRFESTPQLRPFNCFSACKVTGSVVLPTR
ncbi:MAG TPA: LPS export ABC transporter periplasmic protein LptC [Gemmatimonas sp.]|nr:LPS export ABC transporter periplasmic protein LptC [Gemmatimonas sp.]